MVLVWIIIPPGAAVPLAMSDPGVAFWGLESKDDCDTAKAHFTQIFEKMGLQVSAKCLNAPKPKELLR